MADVHEPEVRSYNMSQIKAKDTSPELTVRTFLHARGIRYRLHSPTLSGKPDLALKKFNTVIFIHGCFWHGHDNCPYFKPPKSNIGYWQNKIGRNRKRDQIVHDKLSEAGWNVMTVWECELKKDNKEKTLDKIYRKLLKLGKHD